MISYIKYLYIFPFKWYEFYKLSKKYPYLSNFLQSYCLSSIGFMSYKTFKERQLWIEAAKKTKSQSSKEKQASAERGQAILSNAGYFDYKDTKSLLLSKKLYR